MNILITNAFPVPFDETYINRPIGGSETWAIQLSDAFRAAGHNVVILANCVKSHVSACGTVWVDTADAGAIAGKEFDFIIVSRMINSVFGFLTKHVKFSRMFLQYHDSSTPDRADVKRMLRTGLSKVVALTEWHRRSIIEKDGIDERDIAIIPNGVDPALFPRPGGKIPDHSILWSSRFERGLDILLDVAKIVRRSIPDFKVFAATYDIGQKERLTRSNDILTVIPGMDKKTLYSEMYKHACWFYPSSLSETFCITVLENMMADCNVVMFPDYGPNDFRRLIRPLRRGFTVPGEEYAMACGDAASRIIDCIVNFNSEENRTERENAIRYILGNFTWRNVADKYIEMFRSEK